MRHDIIEENNLNPVAQVCGSCFRIVNPENYNIVCRKVVCKRCSGLTELNERINRLRDILVGGATLRQYVEWNDLDKSYLYLFDNKKDFWNWFKTEEIPWKVKSIS